MSECPVTDPHTTKNERILTLIGTLPVSTWMVSNAGEDRCKELEVFLHVRIASASEKRSVAVISAHKFVNMKIGGHH